MGLGVLEPRGATGRVPGTALLLPDRSRTHEGERSRKGDILLVPQASSSPQDPLNWPIWKKDLATLILSVAQGLAGVQGVLFSVATAQTAMEFEVNLLKAETLQSYQLLAVGVSCLLSSVLARIFGKRPVYILSASIELASIIWTGAGTSFNSVLGSRILYGLGAGAFESIVISSIGDMYFVHERGRRIAFYNLLGLGCSQLSPVLGGYLTDTYGWRSQAWILVAFWAVTLLGVFFGVPESTYARPLALETDLTSNGLTLTDEHSDSEQYPESPTAQKEPKMSSEAHGHSSLGDKPKTYWQELTPLSKIDLRVNPLALILRLFLCGLYIPVWWSFLVIGTYIAWFVGISVTLAQIFSVPPLSFDSTHLGYLNTFGAPAALVAFCFMAFVIDRSCRLFAQHNHRVYEPEFRLPPMIVSMVIGVIGFALYGWYAGKEAEMREISWVAASFIYGMLIFAVVASECVAFSYLLDAYREISVEIIVFSVMARNFFSYGSATFLPLWLETSGVANTFYALAGIQAGLVTLTTIGVYVFGKRMRNFYDRHSPLRAAHAGVAH